MHFLWEILQEIMQENLAGNFKICKSSAGNAVGNVVGNAAGNSVGNLVGNGWGNDAVFSLNTWLRTIYCLQTIHEPACVILTLFNIYLYSLSFFDVDKKGEILKCQLSKLISKYIIFEFS